MLSLFCSFTDAYFVRQQEGLVFFPYGIAWPGYVVSEAQRERIRPYVFTYVVLKALILAMYLGLDHWRDTDAALDMVTVPILGLTLSYLWDMRLLTQGLPKAAVDLAASEDAAAKMVRRMSILNPLSIWVLYGLVALACLMEFCAVAAFLISAAKSPKDTLSLGSGILLFGLCLAVLVGLLRLARMQRQQALG